MNLKMGSQVFANVEVPLLWGTRAILQDPQGKLSIIDLSGDAAKLEIIGDQPAPGVGFKPHGDGTTIIQDGKELYSFDPKSKMITSHSLGLPEVQISPNETRIGTNRFAGNMVSGFGVGISVSSKGIGIGAPLPKELAKLRV